MFVCGVWFATPTAVPKLVTDISSNTDIFPTNISEVSSEYHDLREVRISKDQARELPPH